MTQRDKLTKRGYKVTRSMNTGKIIAEKNGRTVTGDSYADIFRKIN